MRWVAALLLCLVPALAACGAHSSNTLPAVAGGFGTDPPISLPGGTPPASLVVRTLSQGSGPVVRPDDYVLFDVEGKVWAGDRLVIDSFTNHQLQGLPLRSGLPAWRHLAGQRVGSRVLLVIPPSLGYGKSGSPPMITGSDTLVYAVDILAAIHG